MSKEQLYDSFWQLVKRHKFEVQKPRYEGVGIRLTPSPNISIPRVNKSWEKNWPKVQISNLKLKILHDPQKLNADLEMLFHT